MLMYMFTMNLFLSLTFIFMNHPLSLGCLLLIQTILVSLMSGFLYMNFWFSYILFLIMVGGMLVMFIYMTSIASNEKFNLPKTSKFLSTIITFSLIMVMLALMDTYYSNLLNVMTNNNTLSNNPKNLSLSKYFNYPSNSMMIFLMIYLLIVLIAIVKITSKQSGTLRQK